ncbi:MAG: UTRA domain-containing protein, partial [Candidatus Dormibacteraceae bacterium]
ADAVEPVFDLRRRKRTDGDWVALERTHVPFRLAPHLLDEPLESWTTYDYLRRRGVALRRARMYVRPRQLDAAEAALLDTEAGAVNASRTRRMAPGLRSRDSRCAPTRSTSSSSTTSLEVGPKPAEIRALPNELKSGNAAHPGRVVAEAAGQV